MGSCLSSPKQEPGQAHKVADDEPIKGGAISTQKAAPAGGGAVPAVVSSPSPTTTAQQPGEQQKLRPPLAIASSQRKSSTGERLVQSGGAHVRHGVVGGNVLGIRPFGGDGSTAGAAVGKRVPAHDSSGASALLRGVSAPTKISSELSLPGVGDPRLTQAAMAQRGPGSRHQHGGSGEGNGAGAGALPMMWNVLPVPQEGAPAGSAFVSRLSDTSDDAGRGPTHGTAGVPPALTQPPLPLPALQQQQQQQHRSAQDRQSSVKGGSVTTGAAEGDDFVPIEADEEKMERAVHAVRTRVEQSSAASSMISGAWQQMICVLSSLGIGSERFRFLNRYEMQQGRNFGATAVIAEAIEVRGPRRTPVAIKFFLNPEAYKKEREFFHDIIPSLRLTVAYLDECDDPLLPDKHTRLPPCIVMERGDYTLQEFMRRGRPNRMALKGMLMDVVEAVDEWHQRGLVYRDLKPGNIMFFSAEHRWKLIDVGSWARAKQRSPLSYTLRYTATEVLRAEYEGRTEERHIENSDMWSLGAVIYEILTGRQLLGYEYNDDQVVKMLVGVQPLPWEENASFFDVIDERAARRMLVNMLARRPELRWTTKRVMASSFFMAADPTVDKEMTKVALERLEQGIHQRLDQQEASSQENFDRMSFKYQENTDAIRSNLKHLSFKAEEILVKVSALESIGLANLQEASTNALAAVISFWEVNTGGLDITNQAAMHLLETRPSTITQAPMDSWPQPDPNEPVFSLHIGATYILKLDLMRVGSDGSSQAMPDLELQKLLLHPEPGACIELNPVLDLEEPLRPTAASVWNLGKLGPECLSLQQTSDYLHPVSMTVELHMTCSSCGEQVFTLSKTALLNMRPRDEALSGSGSFCPTAEWTDAAPAWLRSFGHGSVALAKVSGGLIN